MCECVCARIPGLVDWGDHPSPSPSFCWALLPCLLAGRSAQASLAGWINRDLTARSGATLEPIFGGHTVLSVCYLGTGYSTLAGTFAVKATTRQTPPLNGGYVSALLSPSVGLVFREPRPGGEPMEAREVRGAKRTAHSIRFSTHLTGRRRGEAKAKGRGETGER